MPRCRRSPSTRHPTVSGCCCRNRPYPISRRSRRGVVLDDAVTSPPSASTARWPRAAAAAVDGGRRVAGFTTSASLTLFCHCLLLSVAAVSGIDSIRGPPKLHPIEPFVVRPQGENLKLSCPATANPKPFFDWIKDGESLELSWDPRIKQNRRGELKIKDLKPEDAGMYICKVINGFGNAEVGVTLLVLDRSQVPESELSKKGSIGSAPVVVKAESDPPGIFVLGTEAEDPSADGGGAGGGGSGSSTSPAAGNLLLRTRPGIRANFSCEAEGLPVPEIQWFKDGKFLDPGSWDRRQLRGPKLSSLVFDSVNPRDAGLYSCRAVSPLGAHSKNFTLEIEDGNHTAIRPELMGNHPENTTVVVGELAALQCMVVSDGPLHIEWLKVMEPHEVAEYLKHQDPANANGAVVGGNGRERKTVDLNGRIHWILNAGSGNRGIDYGNRTHLSKLVIRRASASDSGTYVCLAANSMGFNYREARLIVREPSRKSQIIPPAASPTDTGSTTASEAVESEFPALRVVTFICVAIVVVVVISAVALRCRRKSSASEASVETRYSASKPRATPCGSSSAEMGVTFASIKHDLSSVKTSDSSLIGTPAHLRTPPSLVKHQLHQHGNNHNSLLHPQHHQQHHQSAPTPQHCWQTYYPIPSSVTPTFSASMSMSAAAGGGANAVGRGQQQQQQHLVTGSCGGGGGRVYHQASQQPSLCEEAYEELDFVRRSPGVGDESLGICFEGGSLLHNGSTTTPSFDGYDHLPALSSFHASFGGNNRGFRIIPNPNAFMK